MGECTWLYGEWPNLGVGVVVWGVAKSCGGWVWLYGEWPNLVVGCGCMVSGQIWGWVGVVVWGVAKSGGGWVWLYG